MPSLTKLTSTLLPITAALTTASPLLAREDCTAALHPRDEWQISASTSLCLYMTTEANWGGEAQNLCNVGGKCGTQLPDGLAANVSSAGPEAGVTCFLYSETDCTGDRSAPLVEPGYADLKPIGFDKKAQSWECWKWCGWMGPSSSSSSAAVPASSAVRALEARLISITTTLTIDGAGQGASSTSVSAAAAVTTTSSSASQAVVFETSMTTIVVTHTYADGSTTVMSTPLALPIPVASTAQAGVSITTTIGQTMSGPTPWESVHPDAFTSTGGQTLVGPTDGGVSITTTLSAGDFETTSSESTMAPSGVSITTTEPFPTPVSTQTSEGVTVAVPTVSPFTNSTSFGETSTSEAGGWTSVVTLTGLDATLTVTVTGGPVASSTG